MRTFSIRTHLTLWYFCFFAVRSLILSVSSWFLLRRSLELLTLHELDERLDDIESVWAPARRSITATLYSRYNTNQSR